MKEIKLPVQEQEIRRLEVGDEVYISGTMITARDTAHKYLVENHDPQMALLLKDSMIYHCGPVVRKDDQGYHFVAAGPTTSKREEPYEAEVIARYGVRAVIGKGGMGERTLHACREHGAVYLHAIGGLAVLLAKAVKKVSHVYKLEEFGTPEAMWVIEVEKFPALVTMDSHGRSLHQEVLEYSTQQAKSIAEKF